MSYGEGVLCDAKPCVYCKGGLKRNGPKGCVESCQNPEPGSAGPAAPGSDPPSDGVRPADPPLDLSTRPPTDSVQGSPRRSVRCSLANSVRPGLHRTLDTASTGLNPVIFTNFLGTFDGSNV